MREREDGGAPLDERRLVELAALPADDPRRVAAERDPEVRAWLLEYEAFAHGAALTEADRAAVEHAAATAFARAAGEEPAAPPVAIPLPPRRPRAPAAPWLALAASLAVVVAGALVVQRMGGHGSRELRGAPRAMAPAPGSVTLVDGVARLRWEPVPGADAYVVEVLSGLETVARFEAGPACTLSVPLDRLPGADGLLWRAVALEHGETLATTPPRPLPR